MTTKKNSGAISSADRFERSIGRRPRLLLIGARTLRDTLLHALPDHDVFVAEHALDGVWQSGRQSFDGAFVSLSAGSKALRAVSSLRQICPRMRIVVGCDPIHEPIARRALDEGADEYVLEPIRRGDVESAFGVPSARGLSTTPVAPAPTGPEFVELSEILRRLGDGPLATLERLAALLQETFDAAGVELRLDELSCAAGDTSEPVLEEIIRRGEQPVGRIGLARRRQGTYAADVAARLAQYARLTEAMIAQARERQRWRELAWTDDLSQLRNRRYLEQAHDELIRRAIDRRLRLTVLLFDIDDFKSYNDWFGHDIGDKLIQEVAVLLRHCTREQDVVVRYGGDEFAVVFWDAERQRVPGSEHPREPMQLAARFCKAIARHNFQCLGSQAPGPVTISGGLACFPWNGRTPDQLLAAADQALLTAKRTGKNRIHLAGRAGEQSAPPR